MNTAQQPMPRLLAWGVVTFAHLTPVALDVAFLLVCIGWRAKLAPAQLHLLLCLAL